MLDSRYNLLAVDFLIRLVGGSDNGQLELVLVSSNWLTLLMCYVRLLIKSSNNNCDEKEDKSSFWSGGCGNVS